MSTQRALWVVHLGPVWEVILLDEVDRWFMQVVETDQEEAVAVAGAIDVS